MAGRYSDAAAKSYPPTYKITGVTIDDSDDAASPPNSLNPLPLRVSGTASVLDTPRLDDKSANKESTPQLSDHTSSDQIEGPAERSALSRTARHLRQSEQAQQPGGLVTDDALEITPALARARLEKYLRLMVDDHEYWAKACEPRN